MPRYRAATAEVAPACLNNFPRLIGGLSVPPLLSVLLIAVSAGSHSHPLNVIEFIQAEKRILKDKLRGKRICGRHELVSRIVLLSRRDRAPILA